MIDQQAPRNAKPAQTSELGGVTTKSLATVMRISSLHRPLSSEGLRRHETQMN